MFRKITRKNLVAIEDEKAMLVYLILVLAAIFCITGSFGTEPVILRDEERINYGRFQSG